jgi:serine/threonine-protein kinase RsbW
VRIQVVLTLPREAVSVPLARHTVAAALRSAGITQDCLAEVEVALSEACTNVFHHANAGASYEVAISIGDQQLTMEVVDSGAGIGWRPHEPASMPNGMAEGGRGLALMTALTDHALFDSVTGEGGAVHLTKRLRWTEDAPLVNSTDGNGVEAAVPAPEPLHTGDDASRSTSPS